ncbi:MAG: DNA polymerase IV [Clostridiales bacterium]|nr:DNA polymerase IV [Clostridiales bacterium]
MVRIIHVDMDAFFAAVEVRDNPELAGKPLIIGALPHERGVVSTCSYEARKYGVRSAMPISQAFRLCPHGIFMHGNFAKYIRASQQIRKVWESYTDLVEKISLDEGFLDITGSEHLFGGARQIAQEIKARTLQEVGLTCSVGIGYSKMSAKLASEEKKPDGLFEIPDIAALHRLILDRPTRTIYGIGTQTAAKLAEHGILTVRQILENERVVETLLGKYGREIVLLARGADNRRITAAAPAKSLGKERTFQEDITDFERLKDNLVLIAKRLAFKIQSQGIFCKTITLKVTYSGMKRITRNISGDSTNCPREIAARAIGLLEKIERRPVRLVGISLSGFSDRIGEQLNLFDMRESQKSRRFAEAIFNLQYKFGLDIIKTGRELIAEKNLYGE